MQLALVMYEDGELNLSFTDLKGVPGVIPVEIYSRDHAAMTSDKVSFRDADNVEWHRFVKVPVIPDRWFETGEGHHSVDNLPYRYVRETAYAIEITSAEQVFGLLSGTPGRFQVDQYFEKRDGEFVAVAWLVFVRNW